MRLRKETLSDYQYWLNMVERKKKSYFFVCSDGPFIESTINNLHDNVIIHHKDSSVRKADERANWCQETIDLESSKLI